MTGSSLLERAAVLASDAQFDLCASAGRPMPDGVDPSQDAGSERAGRLARTARVAAVHRPADPAPAAGPSRRRARRPDDLLRHVAVLQGPRGPVPVLKTLQTNACAKDCAYCPFRAGRELRREAFTSDELARLVDDMHRAGLIRGLFLSSGVVGHDDHSMAQIVATGEILRRRLGYSGYLHLKLMPAASDAAIEAALAVADRVSINLEAPNAERLAALTSTKRFGPDLLAPLRRVKRILEATGRFVGRTTQFVVGAAGESDAEILSTTHRAYRELGLSRVYYSAFRPVPDTPLEGMSPESPVRERRLYQADFLLRDYAFELEDLPIVDGRLPLGVDPKLAWAASRPDLYPVDVNRAGRWELIRVPGIGPRVAERIIRQRPKARLRGEADLRRIGVPARALPWLSIDGRLAVAGTQLALPE